MLPCSISQKATLDTEAKHEQKQAAKCGLGYVFHFLLRSNQSNYSQGLQTHQPPVDHPKNSGDLSRNNYLKLASVI